MPTFIRAPSVECLGQNLGHILIHLSSGIPCLHLFSGSSKAETCVLQYSAVLRSSIEQRKVSLEDISIGKYYMLQVWCSQHGANCTAEHTDRHKTDIYTFTIKHKLPIIKDMKQILCASFSKHLTINAKSVPKESFIFL